MLLKSIIRILNGIDMSLTWDIACISLSTVEQLMLTKCDSSKKLQASISDALRSWWTMSSSSDIVIDRSSWFYIRFWRILSSFHCSSQAFTRVSISCWNDLIALEKYIDCWGTQVKYLHHVKSRNVLTYELHRHLLNHSCQCSQIKHCTAVQFILLPTLPRYHRRCNLRWIGLNRRQLQDQS